MSYDIIVRFPDEKMAKEFCAQMCDGFGEGLCDFTPWQQKPNTDGKQNDDYVKITSAAPANTPVFFVNSIEEF